jgi:acetate kinase
MLNCGDHDLARNELANWLITHYRQYPITVISHRIVQGGPHHRVPELINEQLLQELHRLIDLAPNHLPDELETIKKMQNVFPEAIQVACYDTFFHTSIPGFIQQYPFPSEYQDEKLIKYGFHGLSYEYLMNELKKQFNHIDRKRVILAHLGSGASMVAVRDGKSLDTTMGLTPMGGLLMGTRTGDIDPGVPLFIMKHWKLSVSKLDELFSKQSGLKAIAGTANMHELIERMLTEAPAAQAVEAFIYSVKKQIGAFAAAMGGVDLVVFTGGIGENAAYIRHQVCKELGFLGIRLHKNHNKHHYFKISSGTSKVKVLVLPTDEEMMIARHAFTLTHSNHKVS